MSDRGEVMEQQAVRDVSAAYLVEAGTVSTEDVPPGYKRTEVGVISEAWGVQPFGCIAYIERGKFTARPRNDPKYYGGNIPFIQTGDVKNAFVEITSYSQTLIVSGSFFYS
jgi:type I restriction enzyme S subunit